MSEKQIILTLVVSVLLYLFLMGFLDNILLSLLTTVLFAVGIILTFQSENGKNDKYHY